MTYIASGEGGGTKRNKTADEASLAKCRGDVPTSNFNAPTRTCRSEPRTSVMWLALLLRANYVSSILLFENPLLPPIAHESQVSASWWQKLVSDGL
jgi:hypothetical protein